MSTKSKNFNSTLIQLPGGNHNDLLNLGLNSSQPIEVKLKCFQISRLLASTTQASPTNQPFLHCIQVVDYLIQLQKPT